MKAHRSSSCVAACVLVFATGCATASTSEAPPTRADLDATLLRAANDEFTRYDPTAVIDAVNALVPLGKDAALETIARFLERRAGNELHQGLFLVLRVLFDAPATGHPPMRIGGSHPEAPAAADALPRFPVVLVDDVPLMLVSGYMLGGEPESVSAHVEFYRAHGVIRTAPLAPTRTLAERWAELEMVYRGAYGVAPAGSEREHLHVQLARVP
jgi:hypothetical protein